jgi:hypothetical protein
LYSQFPAGADDPDGDFTPVGYQETADRLPDTGRLINHYDIP